MSAAPGRGPGPSTKAIKAVAFDLGGVVLGSPLQGIARYEQEANLPSNFINVNVFAHGEQGSFQKLERGEVSIPEFLRTFKEELESKEAMQRYVKYIQSRQRGQSGQSGQSGQNNQRSSSHEQAQLPETVEVDTHRLFALMSETSAEINESMLHALCMLKGNGIATIAVTNNFEPIPEQESDLNAPSDGVNTTDKPMKSLTLEMMHSFFDHVIESCRVGVRKPSPEIFKIIEKTTGVPLSETAFLDDIGTNVKAARKLGMHTIKVEMNGANEALKTLEKMLQPSVPISATGTGISLLPPRPNELHIPSVIQTPAGVDGGILVSHVFGSAVCPPVVVLHGGGQHKGSWGNVGVKLAEAGFCAIMVDQKGHGESYWDRRSDATRKYNFTAYSEDLDRLIRIMGLANRRPALVGASLGGLASLGSQTGQELASCIILVDVTPKLELKGVDRVLQFMTDGAKSGFASLEEAAEAVAAYNPNRNTAQSSLEGLKKNLKWDDQVQKWFWHWDPSFVGNTLSPTKDELNYAEMILNKAAQNITAPTLLIRGKLTDLISKEGTDALQQVIPHSELVDIADAGHMVAGDSNEIFSQEILKFLERNRARFRVYENLNRNTSTQSKL